MIVRSETTDRIGSAALRVAVFFMALTVGVGCITPQQQGDRAYEAGDYKKAKGFYDQAIEEGSEEPDLYVNAARTALKLGNLATAERLYGRALRFGGGPRVAKELARYYVQTSNYASAVRVYQYLLYQTKDPQPVYNNLGTALLYSGQHFDAESYLLVAQQMDPGDPLPYLNLGLLYDEHLKQPWLAMNFYQCFVELSGDNQQSSRVRARISEIEPKWRRLYDPTALECGKVYTPRTEERPLAGPSGDIKIDLNLDQGDEPAETTDTKDPEPVPIDRMVESLPEPERTKDPEKAAKSPLEVGRAAFEAEKWNEVIVALQAVPLSELETRDLAMLGAALYQAKRYEDAVQWLELVASKNTNDDTVILLVDAHFRAGDFDAVGRVCERYAKDERTPGVAKHCRERISRLPGAPKVDEDEGPNRPTRPSKPIPDGTATESPK